MTENAPTLSTADEARISPDVIAGGGDPFFETDPRDVTTPADLQRRATAVLGFLLTLELPACMWTVWAPSQARRVRLYTRAEAAFPSLTGIPEGASDVTVWAARFGVSPYRDHESMRTRFCVGGLVVELQGRIDPSTDPLGEVAERLDDPDGPEGGGLV